VALIGEKDRKTISQVFSDRLDGDVTLVLFTHGKDSPEYDECQFCDDMEELLTEIASMSPQLDVAIHHFSDEKVRDEYAIKRAPALAIVGEQDYGIRYYGIPSGYEAQSLLDDIIDVSAGQSRLSTETKKWLAGLDKPVHLQVFVTPMCPHCPSAVRTAHQLALESNMVTADAIEAMEFPELAREYEVYAVPKIVINDKNHFEGALPEKQYVAEIRKALIGLASLS